MVELTAGERLLAKLIVTVEHGLGAAIPERVICQMANDIQCIVDLGIRLEVALTEAAILSDPELARREGREATCEYRGPYMEEAAPETPPAKDNQQPTTAREIVVGWLREHGYDGLSHYPGDCGCETEDLMPCDPGSVENCEPSYKVSCDCGEGCEWHMSPTREQARQAPGQ